MANISIQEPTESTSLLPSSTDNISPSKASVKNNGISWYFAVFLIVNAALGAGVLNFAKAYDSAGGILISSLMQLVRTKLYSIDQTNDINNILFKFLVLVIIGALLILAYLTDKKKSANFQDVVYSQCGKRWQTINSLCIIIYMFGCCITFFIIIGDQLDQSKHT